MPACFGQKRKSKQDGLMCKHSPRVRYVNVCEECKRAEQTLWTEGKRYCLCALFLSLCYVREAEGRQEWRGMRKRK